MPQLLQDGLGRNTDAQAFERLGSVLPLLCSAAPDSLQGDGSDFIVGAIRVGGASISFGLDAT